MIEDLADDQRVFNAGNDLHWAAANMAGFDIDAEHALEPLCPGHGGMALGGCSVLCFIGGLAALAAPGRCDQRPVLAVGCEHAMETGEVDAGFGDQGGERV